MARTWNGDCIFVVGGVVTVFILGQKGPAEIVATDNGDPKSFESFQSHDRNAFNGLCLVVIHAKPDRPGRIKLTATADGLQTGKSVIRTRLERNSI